MVLGSLMTARHKITSGMIHRLITLGATVKGPEGGRRYSLSNWLDY